jgi:hypothetical protein
MKEHGEIIGLNYCQGDDLEYFFDNFDEIDHELTDFYHAVKHYLSGKCELERINQVIEFILTIKIVNTSENMGL